MSLQETRYIDCRAKRINRRKEKTMKIMLVFGTRPEAIKMCPIIKELKRHQEIETVVCITGQHREMLKPILDVFQVIPHYNLDIMKEKQDLFDITINVLQKIREVLDKERPDIVLVHGDTTSAFATAMACFYMGIPVGHVEAGLRTYNKFSPYPEEFNRQAVDVISDLYFAPTDCAKENLLAEGKEKETIFVTGNTVIDALKTTVSKEFSSEILDWAKGSRLILLTAHRRENIGNSMQMMFEAIKEVVEAYEDIKVVYPVHMNPVVRQTADDILGETDRIRLIEPLDVVAFHNLMDHAYLIMTDSGGIQEEAPSLGKPVLVMRDTTERPEGIAAGTLKLVGTRKADIKKHLIELLTNPDVYQSMAQAKNPYGDGRASERIIQILGEWADKRQSTTQTHP